MPRAAFPQVVKARLSANSLGIASRLPGAGRGRGGGRGSNAGWGKRLTASCPSAADRRLKGRGEEQNWACQKDPGERWQHFPGTSLRASLGNTPPQCGCRWGLVPTSYIPQPMCAESRSKGFALGREAVRAKHERSSPEGGDSLYRAPSPPKARSV